MQLLRIILSMVLVFPTALNAASFDCKKASTKIEILICSDKRLSKKDETLSKEYNDLLSVVHKETREKIRRIQRYWLSLRNKIDGGNSTDIWVRMAYDSQIDRLVYFRESIAKDLNINNPNILVIFKLLIDESLPEPDSILKIGNSQYLLEITNTGRVGQGLYAVNTRNKMVSKVLRGLPDIIHLATEKRPVHLVKTTTMGRGVMTTSIGAAFKDNSDLGVSSKWIISFQTDGESGECNRGPSIGLKKISDLIKYSFDSSNSELVLILYIVEEDCITKKTMKYQKKFIFNDLGYKELL